MQRGHYPKFTRAFHVGFRASQWKKDISFCDPVHSRLG